MNMLRAFLSMDKERDKLKLKKMTKTAVSKMLSLSEVKSCFLSRRYECGW